MAGQYGNVNKTIQNLTVLEINDVDDLLYVKGSVPGPKNGYITVRDAIKSSLPENVLKPAGLKDNETLEVKKSDQKEIIQDSEAKTKSQNVEVKNEELNEIHYDLAASVQKSFEDICFHLLKKLYEKKLV